MTNSYFHDDHVKMKNELGIMKRTKRITPREMSLVEVRKKQTNLGESPKNATDETQESHSLPLNTLRQIVENGDVEMVRESIAYIETLIMEKTRENLKMTKDKKKSREQPQSNEEPQSKEHSPENIPDLFHSLLIAVGKPEVRKQADKAIRDIVENSSLSTTERLEFMNQIFDAFYSTENDMVRRRCFESLKLMLTKWPMESMKDQLDIVKMREFIRDGLHCDNVQVQKAAAQAQSYFVYHWPEEERFFRKRDSLTAEARTSLNKHKISQNMVRIHQSRHKKLREERWRGQNKQHSIETEDNQCDLTESDEIKILQCQLRHKRNERLRLQSKLGKESNKHIRLMREYERLMIANDQLKNQKSSLGITLTKQMRKRNDGR